MSMCLRSVYLENIFQQDSVISCAVGKAEKERLSGLLRITEGVWIRSQAYLIQCQPLTLLRPR